MGSATSQITRKFITTTCYRVVQPTRPTTRMPPTGSSRGWGRHAPLACHPREWAFTHNNFRQQVPLSGFSGEMEFRECDPWASWLSQRNTAAPRAVYTARHSRLFRARSGQR